MRKGLHFFLLWMRQQFTLIHSSTPHRSYLKGARARNWNTTCAERNEPQIENEWRHHFHNNKKLKNKEVDDREAAVTCYKAVNRYAESPLNSDIPQPPDHSTTMNNKGISPHLVWVISQLFDVRRWRYNKRWGAVVMAIWRSGLHVKLRTWQ